MNKVMDKSWPQSVRGLDAGMDRSSLWTGLGHGLCADTDELWPRSRTGRGHGLDKATASGPDNGAEI